MLLKNGIKKKNKTNSFSNNYVAFAVLLSVVFFISGFFFHRSHFYYKNFRPFLLQYFKEYKPDRYVKSKINNNLQDFNLHVNFKNYKKLEYHRQKARSSPQLLTTDSSSYVSGVLENNNGMHRVDLRVKGKFGDHHNSLQPSFRIKVKDGKTIQGMKNFALQSPGRRGLLLEWILHKVFKEKDIISLRYNFVNFFLNGENLGIYVLEEHFDNETLIENNKRRKGPIIKFFDEGWLKKIRYGFFGGWDNESYYKSQVKPYKNQGIFIDSTQFANFEYAFNKLQDFRTNGHVDIDQIINIKIFAKYLAINDYFGAIHGSRDWSDYRLYYNPITTLFEPIAYDLTDYWTNKFPDRELIIEKENLPFLSKITSNHLFQKNYIFELSELVRTNFFRKTIRKYSNEIGLYVELIMNDNRIYPQFKKYPFVESDILDTTYLNKRHSYIENVLDQEHRLHAYFERANNDSLVINIGNAHALPVELVEIKLSNYIATNSNKKQIINGMKQKDNLIKYRRYFFNLANENIKIDFNTSLKLRYKKLGLDKIFETKINMWSNKMATEKVFKNAIFSPNVTDFEQLKINEESKEIYFLEKNFIISKNLIFPHGYSIIGQPGQKITFENNAKMISYSQLIFNGEEDRPIIIETKGRSESSISLINTKGRSIFSNVHFFGSTEPYTPLTGFTGYFNTYESDIDIFKCLFENNAEEDFLNLIRSNFNISFTNFINSKSDAIDSDFSSGSIKSCKFFNLGNDAIDISGTDLIIENIFIDRAMDKGLSIGEKSHLIGQNIEISNSNIGIACKDLSKSKLSELNISYSNVGLACYQKKPEFGPARIQASNSELTNIVHPYYIDNRSNIIFNDKSIYKIDKSNIQAIFN